MQFQVILTSIALTVSLALPAAASARVRHAAKPDPDAVVQDMAEAYKKLDRQRLSTLLPQVRGHVLEPWAAYWELSARLDDAAPEEVHAFLTRYAGTYQEDRLRNEWLLLLGKRRDWDGFLAEYPRFRMNDDASVRCYALMAEAARSDVEIAQQVQDLWLAQRDAEDGCTAAVAQQLAAEKIRPQVVWQRARLGIEYDKPQIARQAVALLKPEWAETVTRLYAHPARYLDGKVTAILPHTKELVTLALIRLADRDLDAAAGELDKLRWKIQLSQEELSWAWGVIGKRAARLMMADRALAYYANGNPLYMHRQHLLWRVRAALLAGDWEQVQDAIANLPERELQDPSWIYWRARALQALKVPNADMRAHTLYRSIASPSDFYGQLALEALGERVTVPGRPAPLTEPEREAARRNPGLQRALHAIKIGLRSEGVREWHYSISLHQRGGMSDRELLAAADLACEAQVWDRCINTSDRTRGQIDVQQRYPMPFRPIVVQRSELASLEPAYVYGLIRQESRFISDAQSSVGAAGLMQVMPETARWTARKIGLRGFKTKHIKNHETNIAIGTSYLRLVLDAFEGSMPLAAAAYNAGPARVRSWLDEMPQRTIEAAIWIENVPFTETRDYVKKVMANATNYAALLTAEPQSLRARLGAISSPSVAEAEAVEQLP